MISIMKCLLILWGFFATSCSSPVNGNHQGPAHHPGLVVPASELSPPRNWQLVRGIVHSHSPYSHDACDNEPFTDGVRNEQCFEECRAGMCQTMQDFVFLTDHDDYFAYYQYPQVLLWAEGDRLIVRDAKPVANRIQCPDGREVVLMAGTESAMMPLGLERHLGQTVEERMTNYNEISPAAIDRLHQAGALVFLQHTEGWSLEDVLSLPIDGIECYNLHQNLLDNLAVAAPIFIKIYDQPELYPVPELLLIAVFLENQADLERWARVLVNRPLPAALASDVHRNAFPGPLSDGERADSFRRVMHWFANYMLIPAGPYDDRTLKEALGKGRFYGAFDYLGYAEGFDFHARADRIYEMGQSVPAQQAQLTLKLPRVHRLDENGPAPQVRGLILRAEEGSWRVVKEGAQDLTLEVGPGAYRAEVRMTPWHLERWLGEEAEKYLKEIVWVYSNAIRVGL
jgi:hypothetical protein